MAVRLVLLASAIAVLAACRDPRPATVLLFTGSGASSGDVAALETILTASRLDYATATSAQLNRMPEAAIRRYRLLIVPGGNFVQMGDSLTASTMEHVRDSVRGGVNYLGICAGAFLAGSFPRPYNSVNLTSGVQFHFYGAGRDVHKAPVAIASPDGATLDQYWEDGPELTGWGDAVARYPDGAPAVVQGTFGSGGVLLTGVHPEAPESWRRGLAFRTPSRVDSAYAATLIQAALTRTPLPHF